ncbi:MAG: hypothetical protein KC442_07210 [Thermomicrobiales bacterium]|nr:hypothetical protein [Thermomicrobiales bacterium]
MTALTIGVIHTGSQKRLAAALRRLRQHDLRGAELLVIDTTSKRAARSWVNGQGAVRYRACAPDTSPSVLDHLFAAARGEVVLCLEESVRLRPGALEHLRAYFAEHPDSPDVLHGPLVAGKRVLATHNTPNWSGARWGRRAVDPRGLIAANSPFAVPMHEPGVFSCRRAVWPGMPAAWHGYGAEAGYLQERFRQRGARALCLPGLRWERVSGPAAMPPYSAVARQTLHNHLVGALDAGLDTRSLVWRYHDYLRPGEAEAVWLGVMQAQESRAAPVPPLVSCLLLAGRLTPENQLPLEEAIESFLRQDYREKELVLLNDTPGLTLVCEAPGVRVVNASARCPSLGDALNAAAAFARGEYLALWDRASINLPWRLSFSLAALSDADVYRPPACWYMLDGELDARPGRPDGGQVALFTRRAFRAAGGYASRTLGVHREMDEALATWQEQAGRPHAERALLPAEWFTILRRVQADAQYEGDPLLDPWHAQALLPVRQGKVVLTPQWAEDYTARCLAFVADVDKAPVSMPVPFVVGQAGDASARRFPRLDQADTETPGGHLARVVAHVGAAAAAGATHLVVPRDEADWLAQYPHVAEYLTGQHRLVEVDEVMGFVFALDDEAAAPRAVEMKVARG